MLTIDQWDQWGSLALRYSNLRDKFASDGCTEGIDRTSELQWEKESFTFTLQLKGLVRFIVMTFEYVWRFIAWLWRDNFRPTECGEQKPWSLMSMKLAHAVPWSNSFLWVQGQFCMASSQYIYVSFISMLCQLRERRSCLFWASWVSWLLRYADMATCKSCSKKERMAKPMAHSWNKPFCITRTTTLIFLRNLMPPRDTLTRLRFCRGCGVEICHIWKAGFGTTSFIWLCSVFMAWWPTQTTSQTWEL